MKTVVVPSGIGDILWLVQKLVNTGELFNFVLPSTSPRRGHQVLELLPQVCNSVRYEDGWNYSIIYLRNDQRRYRVWRELGQFNEFVLSANSHLESGRRIEDFLPDLTADFFLAYNTKLEDATFAEKLLDGRQCFGIYTSAYGNAKHKHYNGWGQKEWFTLSRLIHDQTKMTPVIVGAEYDTDLSEMVLTKLQHDRDIPCVKLIGRSLGEVIEVMKRLKYFIGFPSGLSIINETLGKNGLMFYGQNVKNIMGTWAHPARIRSGEFRERVFGDPEIVFQEIASWL